MKTRQAARVSEVIENIIGKLTALPARDEWSTITENWDQVVGRKAAVHALPYRLADKKLYVIVENSMWAFELSHRLKLPILKQLDTLIGKGKIVDLHFRVGELCRH